MRAIALLGAGSAAVHQLRYAIGYGDGAPQALAAHPHGYLRALLPGLLTAAVIALAAVLIRLARGGSVDRTRHARPPLLVLWLGCAVALASVFAVQETLEGAGAFAGGGWIGLAVAVPVGLFVALALRGAADADVSVARVPPVIRIIASTRIGMGAATHAARLLDLRLGARAPPSASVV